MLGGEKERNSPRKRLKRDRAPDLASPVKGEVEKPISATMRKGEKGEKDLFVSRSFEKGRGSSSIPR